MQKQFPIKKEFKPKRGMTIQPKTDRIVASTIRDNWKVGMIYGVAPGIDDVDELMIRGICNGREFSVIEYADNVEEI